MALLEINNVALRGVSAVVPPKKVSSYDFDFFSHEEAELFVDTVGIKNRYMADDDDLLHLICAVSLLSV